MVSAECEPIPDPATEPLVRGKAPWSWKHFSFVEVQMRRKFVHFLLSCKLLKYVFLKKIVAFLSFEYTVTELFRVWNQQLSC